MSTHSLIIDTDIHPGARVEWMLPFLSEPWRTRLAGGNRSSGTLGYWNPGGVNRGDAITPDGRRIEDYPDETARYLLDEYAIDYGILNPGSSLHLAVSVHPDYAAALIGAINDVMIEHWLPADPRYRTSIVVYANDPELAVREIHRLGDHPGVVQVLLPSASRTPYGQRIFHPIYAAAQEYGLPVAIHPGAEGVGLSGPPTAVGYPATYLEWHTGLVGSYIGHLVSMVTEGVFAKFPKLKFVLVEGGISWLPPIMWRLDKNWKAMRSECPWLTRKPSEIILDHFRIASQPIEEPENDRHLFEIFEMMQADRTLMFSSDYPHWDFDSPQQAFPRMAPELRQRIFADNARELYGL